MELKERTAFKPLLPDLGYTSVGSVANFIVFFSGEQNRKTHVVFSSHFQIGGKMAHPINKTSDSCERWRPFASFGETIADGLDQAFTPCPEYCMKKCNKLWKDTMQKEPCSPESPSMKRCIRGCMNFQFRSPS